jgi:hypothetical protein
MKRGLKEEVDYKGSKLHRYIIHQNNGTIVNIHGQVFRSVNNNGSYEMVDTKDDAGIPSGVLSQSKNLLKRFIWYKNDRSGYNINKKRKRLVGYLKKCPRIEWITPNIVRLLPSEIDDEYMNLNDTRVTKDGANEVTPVDEERHFIYRLIRHFIRWFKRL